MFDTTEIAASLGKKLGDAIDEELSSEILDSVVGEALVLVGNALVAAGNEILVDTDTEETTEEGTNE